jgi:HSF-type DNA-binding
MYPSGKPGFKATTTHIPSKYTAEEFHCSDCDSSCGFDHRSMTSSQRTEKEHPLSVTSVKHPSSPRRTRPTRCIGGQKTRIRHLITQHDYHDHAADPVVCNTVESMNALLSSSKPRRDSITSSSNNNSTSSMIPFPIKLYEMIEQMDSDGLSQVVSWQPHGRCFQVHEPEAFKHLLQNYFKLSKIASFQRQLNLYGFQRLTAGLDKGSYYHELFLRNRSDLVGQIHRVKVKGTSVRAKANPQDEPNFYMYPPVDALAISAIACDEVTSSSVSMEDMTPRTVSPLDSLEQTDYMGIVFECDEPCFAETSDHCESSSRWEIIRGLVGNLSSTNVLNFDDTTSNLSSNTLQKTISFQLPGLLRNVSSSIFDMSRPCVRMDALNNELNHLECTSGEKLFSREATTALDAYLLTTDGNDEVSFDKLIEEIFTVHHNLDI